MFLLSSIEDLSFDMPWNDDTITPAILLDHIQAMGTSLRMEIQEMEKRITKKLSGKIDNVDARLSRRMELLERNVGINTSLLRQVNKALGDLEQEHLSERVVRLEKHVGIT